MYLIKFDTCKAVMGYREKSCGVLHTERTTWLIWGQVWGNSLKSVCEVDELRWERAMYLLLVVLRRELEECLRKDGDGDGEGGP